MTAPDDPGFDALARRLVRQGGFEAGAYKDRCLRRRIAVRMRACGVHTYDDYLGVLDRQPQEFGRLLDALTINVTKFFRNRETWSWLEAHVLPAALLRREGRLRAWSAGCASGEEAYTIAIALARVLERLGHPEWLPRARIDATDIDRASLDRATQARYPIRAFSEAGSEIPARWCTPLGDDLLEIRPEIRHLVTVGRFDLLRDRPPPAAYDLLVCRNVIIYFDRPTQERLLPVLEAAVVPGGHLVLGRVEALFGQTRQRLELVEPRERVYRKAAA